MDDLSGRDIKGYRLIEVLGVGGFGAVYRASQPAIGREVAIKMILPAFANQPNFIRSFENEAQLVARLEHPHIVPLFDYWREPDGAFLVMRLLRYNLHDAIGAGPFTLERASKVIDQIGSALTVAHRNGVVHRDLKPANILLDDDSNAYLADFGIAKVDTQAEDDDDMIKGSPAYMSPEQVTGGPITPQTDIYALGVVLFEMLAGRQPFSDMTMAEIIIKHLQEPLPSIFEFRSDLTEAVDSIIQQATAKDPANRYQDALSMAAQLRAALAGDDIVRAVISDWDLTTVVNPYKGLRAFEEADAQDFFGREVLIEELLARLRQEHPLGRFLAVVGASGSGKSSVVKAGLLPAIRSGRIVGSENWFIAELVPGVYPLRELESALLSIAYSTTDDLIGILRKDEMGLINAVDRVLPGESDVLLVIDQFEEAFNMAQDEAERTQFLAIVRQAVTHPDSRVRVIVTLRADFLDQPLAYPGYGELIRQRTEFVLPLMPEEIERAISGPAQRVGLEVEPDLLAAVVADIREEPGALPLLQYALTEVFERREGRLLTLNAYLQSGGALGALARRAEELYNELDENSQQAVRQLFLRLVTLGEGTQDTRRRIGWGELTAIAADNPAIMNVREAFVKYRLLTSDRDPQTREPTTEVAHEALLREWGRLREWLNESREDVRLQRRLSAAANEWRASGRDKSFLMGGALLEQISGWARNTDIAITEEERAYLAASLVDKRQQEAREQARRLLQIEMERRARNRLQILVSIMAVAVGVALGLTLFAFTQVQDRENIIATLTLEQGALENRLATQSALSTPTTNTD